MPITKWNYQITDAAEIPSIITKAFDIAQNGRPGPVVIDITKNAQIEMIEWQRNAMPFNLHKQSTRILPEQRKLHAAAELINAARKPLLLLGHGVIISKAEEQLLAFVEKTGMPAGSTLLGLSAMPTAHPLYVGMLGMHGNYGPNILTNEADLIIGCGMRFDDRVTGKLASYATKARIIHIDVDPSEINKNIKVDVGLCADVRETLAALIPLVEKRSHPLWQAEFTRCKEIEHAKIIQNDLYPQHGKLKMSEVIKIVSEKTLGEAIVLADVGQHQMITARYYQFRQANSFVTSGGLGTMGFALPASMGAAIAAPDREIVCVVGDGGFQMTLQELGTIAQEKLPIKIIILNNNFLGMVRQWQEMFFEKRYSFVQLDNPDFVKITEGFGIPAERVSAREEIEAAVQRMLDSKGPYLLDVVVETESKVFPMIPAGAGVAEIRLE